MKQDLLLKEEGRYVVVDSLLREWVAGRRIERALGSRLGLWADLRSNHELTDGTPMNAHARARAKAGFLSRIGLDRPELRAWAMYDWANSAFQSTVITAVFPPFFSSYAAAGLEPADATARFAWATTIAVTITACSGRSWARSPTTGRSRSGCSPSSCCVGVVATLLMATIAQRRAGPTRAVLFMVANIAIASSLVFYDSLLPHIAAPEEIDRVSTAGYAIGFLGGGILLAHQPGCGS